MQPQIKLLDALTPNPDLWRRDNATAKLVVIDAGHGGLDANGRYTTDPKTGKYFDHKDKSLNFHDIKGNSIFYEGVNNRILAKKLKYFLAQLNISSAFCFDFVQDTPLAQRVATANALHTALGGETIFISLHSNAGGGNGWEVHTSIGQTKSDKLATSVYHGVKPVVETATRKMRQDLSDGDVDRENNFYVLANTLAPAILTENDFFDTFQGALLLNDKDYQNKLMQATAQGIANYFKP